MAFLGEHESLLLTLGGAGCLTIYTRSTFKVQLKTLWNNASNELCGSTSLHPTFPAH